MTALQSFGENSSRYADGAIAADMSTTIGGHSSAGVKARNDDAFAAKQPEVLSERVMKGVVACIADGVSESERSHLASQMSVTQFLSDYFSTPDSWDIEVSASRVLKALNDWLSSENQKGHGDAMVTTFSSVIIKSRTAHVFHVGDSRVYRLSRGNFECLTRDHSIALSKDAHVLSAALGMDSKLNVDFKSIDIEEGDLLFLATDGIFSHLTSSDLKQKIESQKDHVNLDAVCESICDFAVESGSTDNVTCGLVRLDSLAIETAEEASSRIHEKVIPPVMAVGNKIDEFEVLRIIHSGTRSHIYKVKNLQSGEVFALKAPSKNFEDDRVYLDGFLREQWVGRRLNHPNLMKIYPASEDSSFLYLVCECVSGQTLREWMQDNPTPSLSKVRDIVDGTAMALRAMHRMGMVHRDIKPENIMVTHDGEIKIIDYGTVQVAGIDELASAIIEDQVVGSVAYSAPEYVLGQKATSQSDVFSLGVVAYELLVGRRPYKLNENVRDKWTFSTWGHEPAFSYRKDLPKWVCAALEKATMPYPKNRYPVLSEFLGDLKSPGEFARKKDSQTSLLENNPIAFWKGFSLILLLINLVLVFQLAQPAS